MAVQPGNGAHSGRDDIKKKKRASRKKDLRTIKVRGKSSAAEEERLMPLGTQMTPIVNVLPEDQSTPTLRLGGGGATDEV